METELYSAIQALMALIEKTDFTREVSVSLNLGNSMLGLVVLVVIISALMGFMFGSAWQEKRDKEQHKTDALRQRYKTMTKEREDNPELLRGGDAD